MRRRGKKAFSLMEAIVVLSLVGLVVGGSFLVFRMGSRGFQQAVSKTGTIGDVHRITRALEHDISLSHFYSATAKHRTIPPDDGGMRRDGLAVVGLGAWGDAGSFEVGTGLPKWDRWLLFYATKEPRGRMVRIELERPPPGVGGGYYPVSSLSGLGALLKDNPLDVPDSLRVTTLSKSVHDFQVELDTYSRLVNLRLTLFNEGGKQMTSETKVEDYLESQFEISPMNSYPEL